MQSVEMVYVDIISVSKLCICGLRPCEKVSIGSGFMDGKLERLTKSEGEN